MKTNRNTPLLGATLGLSLLMQPLWAQESPVEEIDPAFLAQQIADKATQLGLDVDAIGVNLANLPADLEGVEQVFDEMISSVEAVLAGLDEESEVGRGILDLLAYTKASQQRWSDRCAASNKPRDCERVDLWETKVLEAIAAGEDLAAVRRLAMTSLADIRDNREYVIDDIRLGMVDAALETLNGAIAGLGSIVTDMNTLAGDVDPTREGVN